MSDSAMLNVFRDEQPVATLEKTASGYTFKYLPEYLVASQEPIALHLPLSGIVSTGAANLPPYFAGLLPEGVMLQAVRTHSPGLSFDDLFGILAQTGEDAIGDITVTSSDQKTTTVLSLADAAKRLRTSTNQVQINAISGVQPKMSIGTLVRTSRIREQKHAYILKSAPESYPHLVENEAITMEIARKCGFPVAKTEAKYGCLIATRFDRVFDPASRRLKQIHVEDMLQVLDLYNHAKYRNDYAKLLKAAWNLNNSPTVILRMLEIYVFSYLIGNGDLHEKNLSVMRENSQVPWRVTPAYDLVCTRFYPLDHKMALGLYGKDDSFKAKQFIEAATNFNIPEKAIRSSLSKIATSIEKHLARYNELHFDEKLILQVKNGALERIQNLKL